MPRNKNLYALGLEDARITYEGLKHVGKSEKLRHFWLDHTAVRGEGLKHLEGLTELRSLDVSRTKATARGVEAFKRRMPK